MDILIIEQLTTAAIVGVYDWEQYCYQKLIFDLKLAYDVNSFDNIKYNSSYLDYTKVSKVVCDLVKTKSFVLIEDVAEITAKMLMQEFCMLYWIKLRVSKPGALSNAHNVGVCITRRRYKKKILRC